MLITYLPLFFWPIDLLLENNFINILSYAAPAILTYLSILNPVFSLFIPLIAPKLLLLPLFFLTSFKFLNMLKTKRFVMLMVFYTIAAIYSFNNFYGQTIFKADYEKEQEVIRNTQLYDSIFMARLMHNKVRIRLDKFNQNFFELTDPNNYFFEFHPRQPEISNQALIKYPFIAFVPMLIGFIKIQKIKNYKIILAILVSSIMSLSVLNIYDRHDFILYVPLSTITLHGMNNIFSFKNLYTKIFKYIFTLVCLIELMRLILI